MKIADIFIFWQRTLPLTVHKSNALKVLPTAKNSRTVRAARLRFLHLQDSLLPNKDKELPFARHIVSTVKHFNIVQNFVMVMFVRPQKVIISSPKSQVIIRTIIVVKTVCWAIRGFIGTVKSFYHLLVRTVLFGNLIIVGQSYDLSDFKFEIVFEFFSEFHCSKRICTITISNKFKVFW